MTHPPPGHRATQDGNDVVLNQEISETLGTISAGEGDHISGAEGQRVR